MEAIVSLFGANPVAITFPESSSPSLLDLKQHLFDLYHIPIEDQRIQTAGGAPLSTGNDDDDQVPLFENSSTVGGQQAIRCFGLTARLSGGKGGFGSMLRAQGGRMSSQKSTNTDACRDLSGRRIKTVNEAKKMAEYIQKEPERAKAKKESLKRKIEEKLEVAERPTRKHRFEDSKYFDDAEEQVEEVKSAVAAAIKNTVTADVKGKGKGKAKEEVVEKKKSTAVKSLGMWDDMSDYESSENEEEDEQEDDEDEEEAEDSDEAQVPSASSSLSSSQSSSSRSAKAKVSKAKVK
ncbi:MAG: telomere stability and silencing-domain-containing protein [Benniella sp.]|nr:MAG: telomere stability and silencing-domain-containing protein [Benniella sp.]